MFVNRILNEYITKQNEKIISKRWKNFQEFLNKKEFIKNVKEEKYQEGFLKDVFEKCLGYTLESTNPNNYNLTRESKNETDSKKADGVIIVDDKIVGIIELKAQNTKNLDKVENQAFNYLVSNSNARYVIISNFNEIRFYIDKKTKYLKFNLFNLDYEEFKKFHLIFSYESIKKNLPLTLKEKSLNFEKEISNNLYKDFSAFRNNLFEDIIKNNKIDKLKALNLTQKLCDRIIFILFAEDRGLLRPNTIREIREKYKNDIFDEHKLYDFYKIYFKAINEGNNKLDIPKYNGGLFREDKELDNLIISDKCLDLQAQKLSDYDFLSDIDVNILGHIFEQSLTDLEELQANIKNENFDKKKSKRKKDGIFYTPKYITEYIVNNTLRKLCEEKKKNINFNNLDELLEYREWLLNLKIIDPACGSGAFLNQALEFLINEHKIIDTKRRKLEGDLLGLYDIEESILENNLYGIDINSDAVEIAKLSLWIRTAKRGKPLTKLSDKIVTANSLLDNPFEFKFDVVIGNPPYVRQESIKELKAKLKDYEVFAGTADLYVYFYELSYHLLKEQGLNGFICSNKFFRAKYGKNLREFILNKTTIQNIVDFNGVKVFESVTVDSVITILQKSIPQNNSFIYCKENFKNCFEIDQNDLNSDSFIFISKKELNIKKKIEFIGTPLKEWNIKINFGIKTGFNEAFIIDEETKNNLIKDDSKSAEIIKPLLRGRDIKKYDIEFVNLYLINTHNNPPIDIDKYPVIKKHLNKYYDKLANRSDKGISPYHLRNCAYLKDFEKEKIVYSEIVQQPQFYLDRQRYYIDATAFLISGENLKYLLSLLNSNPVTYFFKTFYMGTELGNKGFRYKKVFLEKLPIPQIPKSFDKYFKNIEYLLNMPKKEKYDKEKKYPIAYIDGKEIYITEFLYAKNRGWIKDLRGHSEILKEYFKLLPFIFNYIEEIHYDSKSTRKAYIISDNSNRKIYHIVDKNSFLISIYIVRDKEHKRFLKKAKQIINPNGEAPVSPILSPAWATFWRHLDLLNRLYHELKQNSISQNDFIKLVDIILSSKEKIKKYKKHLDKLSTVEKIEVLEEIENLEKTISQTEKKIDKLVYKIYNLTDEEIRLINDN